MLNGIPLQRKHFFTFLLVSFVSFVLTNDRIEGCPPGVDLDTKKGEVVEGIQEVVGCVDEEWDCDPTPPIEALVPVFVYVLVSSFLRTSFASLLLSISIMDCFAMRIISRVVFSQASTSNSVSLARWYFKWLIPP